MKYTWTATREINRKDRIVKGFMTNLGMQRTPFSAYFDPSGGHQCSACTHRIKIMALVSQATLISKFYITPTANRLQ
jgi:hypothetical protein